MEANEREGILFAQPTSHGERAEVARVCSLKLKFSIPTLVDEMDDSTDLKYYALPDRLYLIGRDGKVAYRGGPGPFGFVAAELEEAVEKYLSANAYASAPAK